MIRLENVLKISLQDVLKTSWRCLEDVFARRLEDILKTYGQDEYIGLDQEVLKTSWRVFWRRKAKANIFVLIKTSWSRLLKTKTKDVFIKTNVCWEISLIIQFPSYYWYYKFIFKFFLFVIDFSMLIFFVSTLL